MNLITRENLFEYKNKIFTLRVLRDSFSNVAITTESLKAAVVDILGRSDKDAGTFSNLVNMKKRITSGNIDCLRDKYNFLVTNNAKAGNEEWFVKSYSISKDNRDIMNSTIKILQENREDILNIFDESFVNGFEKEPKAMQKMVTEGDSMSWLIVIIAALYNTYVVGCVEEEKNLAASLMVEDGVYYTSARLLAAVDISQTGLAEEADFWERVAKWQNARPTDTDAMTFNDEQTEKMAWHIYYMKKEGRLEADAEELSDNDIVRILLDMDDSSFVNGIENQKLTEYRELAEKYSGTNNVPVFFYGIN